MCSEMAPKFHFRMRFGAFFWLLFTASQGFPTNDIPSDQQLTINSQEIIDVEPQTTEAYYYDSENPTTNPPNENSTTLSPEDIEHFRLSRNRAIHNVLRKVLQALGPKFKDELPSAPTNATFTPLDSNLRVLGSKTCPDRYKRCSSQTFYPSCDVPRNTDVHVWEQRFTLYFDIASDIENINRSNVLNATLRLYKNLSLPLNTPTDLIVRLHAFTRSLRRNRERSREISSTRVSSDYVGWVFLDVQRLINRLKGSLNYGIKISITNERNIPWNIPDLFVKMNCEESNENLIPLPFEVIQLGDNTQRYPALNIRSGSQESVEDEDATPQPETLTGFDLSHASRIGGHNSYSINSGLGTHYLQSDGNPANHNFHNRQHYPGYQNTEESSNYYYDDDANYYGDDTESSQHPHGWSINEAYNDQPYYSQTNGRSKHIARYKKQSTPYSSDIMSNPISNGVAGSSQDNLIADQSDTLNDTINSGNNVTDEPSSEGEEDVTSSHNDENDITERAPIHNESHTIPSSNPSTQEDLNRSILNRTTHNNVRRRHQGGRRYQRRYHHRQNFRRNNFSVERINSKSFRESGLTLPIDPMNT